MKTRSIVLLVLWGTLAFAVETPPAADEWWKKAKPPKRHGPLCWSLGVFAGPEIWQGLEELDASPGFTPGKFETQGTDVGVLFSMEAARRGSVSFGIDIFLDRFAHETTENFLFDDSGTPAPIDAEVSYDDTFTRLGLKSRTIFRIDRVVQPSVAFGLAFDQAHLETTLIIPQAQGFTDSDLGLDLILTGASTSRSGKRLRTDGARELS